MKDPIRSTRDLALLYSLASAPFLSEEFDDSPEENLEFLLLLRRVEDEGVEFEDLSFFDDSCPLCVLEMKWLVYERLLPRFEESELLSTRPN